MQRNEGSSQERASLSEKIYEAIKADIISFNLTSGTMLLEQELAHRFKVSRTPVREALRKLEQEGLARIILRKGAFVPEVSARDAAEIDEIRLYLEGAAVRKAASSISADKLDELEASLDALNQVGLKNEDYQAIFEFDCRFHDEILKAAGNKWMRDTVLRLFNVIHRARAINTEKRYFESIAELRAIIAALRAGDPQAAERAMREHITNARFSIYGFP